MVNTQLLRVQNVHTKYRKIFSRVFEFALAEKPRNPRKLMYREYFHVYSTVPLPEIFYHTLSANWDRENILDYFSED